MYVCRKMPVFKHICADIVVLAIAAEHALTLKYYYATICPAMRG